LESVLLQCRKRTNNIKRDRIRRKPPNDSNE
jgi:hypothetical protein